MKNTPYGVYIGEDIELVLTDKYTILFRRNKKSDYLESSLILTQTGVCLGICRTSPCCFEMRKPPDIWRYAFNFNITGTNGYLSTDELKLFHVKIISSENGITVEYPDGDILVACLSGKFDMTDLSPNCVCASGNNVDKCLLEWNVGIRDIVFDGQFIGVTINTYKHMYIFEMTTEYVYCRAARYKTCKQGVIFNQNFRQGIESYMIQDNRMAMDELSYDLNLFDINACSWNDRSVYWSISEIHKEKIMLNGCNDAVYEWNKP